MSSKKLDAAIDALVDALGPSTSLSSGSVRAPYTGAILPWRRRPPWFGVSRPDLPPLSVAQQSFCQSAGRS
jgi:hypothetical protein